ncbi:MAG TPA: hypothetical protein VLA05_00145 [Coriobacteriia bacterium]|nr:hypothetical protein [Coriobacteriia bacterium]
MFSHLLNALQPAGLVLVGAGLVSLVFSKRLAGLDSLLDSASVAKVDPEYSRKWVEVAGAVWGSVGLLLLFASRFIG